MVQAHVVVWCDQVKSQGWVLFCQSLSDLRTWFGCVDPRYWVFATLDSWMQKKFSRHPWWSNTYATHSGTKKTHDWVVKRIADLFHSEICTTHNVTTQQVAKSRGQRCGDIQIVTYLPDASGPVSLVLDLLIVHECWGSSSNPLLNGSLHYPYPTDIDRPLNEAAADKIRERLPCWL